MILMITAHDPAETCLNHVKANMISPYTSNTTAHVFALNCDFHFDY